MIGEQLGEERWLDEFEAQWQRSRQSGAAPPSIESMVAAASVAGADTSSLLTELIRLDLDYRLSPSLINSLGDLSDASMATSQAGMLLEYLDRFPQLRLRCDWVEDELRLRKRRGESINSLEWLGLFPPDSFESVEEHEAFTHAIERYASLAEGSTSHPSGQSTRVGELDVHTGVHDDHSPTPPLPPDLDSWSSLRSRFRQEKLLGQGSFGTVWRAYDSQLRRAVAIKTLRHGLSTDAEHRAALVEEARVAAGLKHPDLLTIHDVVVDDHQVHVVMQWIDGMPLDEWFESKIAAGRDHESDKRLAAIMARISRAVHAAHLAGLIHCDLKPQNILVDAQDNPTILDFGLAIRRGQQETLGGRIIGTPAYMPPEQTFGELNHLDGRADVWSLGVILYRLLTGHPPFDGSGIEKLFESIQTRPLTPCRQLRDDVPQYLSEICTRCLNKRIEDRFPSAAELADALENFVESSTSVSRWIAPTGNVSGLPWTENRLVGRNDLIERVVDRYVTGGERLVTLTGGGGIGKTQTAAAIARRLAAAMTTDVIWIELAGAADQEQFAAAVLAGLGVAQSADVSSRMRLLQTLAIRGPLTLVLDNLEQIIPVATPEIAAWLGQSDSLRLLITSQTPLRIRGETSITLPPLRLTHEEALALFTHRAREAKPDFELTNDTAEDAIEICRMVDGNPLAIELAAARIRLLSVAELRRRLESSFAVLKSGRGDRPERHRTLHNVVQWSFNLLDEETRQALLTIAVWPSPLPIELAESLLESRGIDSLESLDELTSRHLLRVTETISRSMIGCSAAVQRFADETIDENLRSELAKAFVPMVEHWVEVNPGPNESLASHLMSASEWNPTIQTEAIVLADELAGHQWDSTTRVERLKPLLEKAGDWRVRLILRLADAKRLAGMTRRAETLLRDLQEHLDAPECPKAIQWEVRRRRLLAQIRFRQGDTIEAIELLLGAVGCLEPLTGPEAIQSRVDGLLELIEIERRAGHVANVRQHLQQAEALLIQWRSDEDSDTSSDPSARQTRQLRVQIQRGKIAFQQGHLDEAWSTFDQAIAGCDSGTDHRDLQQALLGRAASAAERGQKDAAAVDYDRCEKLCRRIGDLPTLAQSINNRALADDDAGEFIRCRETLARALEIYRRLDDSVGIAIALSADAAACLQLGEYEQAKQLLSSIEVQSAIPPDSIHHAIVLGDLGTAEHRLDHLEEASKLLRECLRQLDRLEIDLSSERLIYAIELSAVLQKLDSPDAESFHHETAKRVAQWPKRASDRCRLQLALMSFATNQ